MTTRTKALGLMAVLVSVFTLRCAPHLSGDYVIAVDDREYWGTRADAAGRLNPEEQARLRNVLMQYLRAGHRDVKALNAVSVLSVVGDEQTAAYLRHELDHPVMDVHGKLNAAMQTVAEMIEVRYGQQAGDPDNRDANDP